MRLAKLNRRARRTELVVEVVDELELLLADVAVLRLERLTEVGIALDLPLLEAGRREDVRAREHRLPAQRADAGLVEHLILPHRLFDFAAADAGSHQAPAGEGVGRVDVAGRLQEATLVVRRHVREESAVGDDRFEQVGRGAETIQEVSVGCRHGG